MSARPKTFPNANTTVSAEKSVAIIESYLVELGADKVMKQYEDIDGVKAVVAISFIIAIAARPVPFQLPADRALTLGAMKRWRGVARNRCTPMQANMVAWRNLTEWLRSQVVHICVGGASLDEVLLPYMMIGDRTLYQRAAALEHGVAGIIPKLGYSGPR